MTHKAENKSSVLDSSPFGKRRALCGEIVNSEEVSQNNEIVDCEICLELIYSLEEE